MEISLEQFRDEWLKDIQECPNELQKGEKFALKLFTQWLELGDDAEIYQCDGSYDGGIDLAYFEDASSESENAEGATWYFVQSKYGTAFQGKETIMSEANKMFDTLEGHNPSITSVTQMVVDQFRNFLPTATGKDKIVFVLVTSDEISDKDLRGLRDVESAGRARFGDIVSACSISIANIYNRLEESSPTSYTVSMVANLVTASDELLVGSIKLDNLYQFMKAYKTETNDLELIYQRNVRKFLGGRKKVNKGIATTLLENPERFGIYNNGITIVVDDFRIEEIDKYKLVNPYIVNGCQTTRTIWDVLYSRLEHVGSGKNDELEDWKRKLSKAVVVTKVVKIGGSGEDLLNNTTKFTNSQNAVSAKDFIALDKNFQEWSYQMLHKYNVFLEIQRGAWDSKKAQMQRQPNRTDLRISDYITAMDALKVYAAGWMQMPGISYGHTPPFSPGGSIFKAVIDDETFDVDCLYAAYRLRKATTDNSFGKNSPIPFLGKGRYLLYLVIIELLKECMIGTHYDPNSNKDVTECIIKIFAKNPHEATKLYKQAYYLIEKYFDSSKTESIYNEVSYKGDLNGFLKKDGFGKRDINPKLYNLIAVTNYIMRETGELTLISNALS